MAVERSVSFKGGESERMISIRASPPDKEKDASTRPVSINSKEMDNLSDDSIERIRKPTFFNPQSPKHVLAVKLAVYKSLRTRRKLADCAVLAEQSWWKLLDFAELKNSSISFFDIEKHESAISRWSRARTRAAKVGKGLSKNDKAQKLALQHWLEAIDPQHRYGHNLHLYYPQWLESKSREPFFYWLDIGEGKEANLENCPRSKLQQQCIKYLGPMERKTYEVVVKEGKLLYKESGELLHTTKDAKWIFVLSTSKSLYVGKKMKGKFQHSSFLAGGVATAAGRLVVDGGVLKAVWPHSGHYRPTEESFKDFLSFLRENNVDLTDVKETSPMDEEDRVLYKQGSCIHRRNNSSDEDLSHAVNDLEIEEVQNLTPENTISVDEKTSSVLEQQKPRQLSNFCRKLTNLKESERSGLVERLNSTEKLFSESCRTRPRGTMAIRNSRRSKPHDARNNGLTSRYLILPYSYFGFRIMDLGWRLWHFHHKKNPIPQRTVHGTTIEILWIIFPSLILMLIAIPSFALLFAMADVVAGGKCFVGGGSRESSEPSEIGLSNENMFDEEQEGNDAEKIPDETIMEMINSKQGITSYQLGSQVSRKWTTGAGPRSSCVRDCPSELQFRARTHSFPPRKGNHWPR
ncbi:IQ DOMAIN-CONTAINING PROTEIN IQM6 [Salix purpurea]|uniref:IQ DOMAIN-CONTAINING PROTEIN IQM6 n=1 Tax=Salix purpurea TaxID=77065 RepID=A0A9Q0TKW0_SALPP|nr:IQ DOMAIN-CONTAINING PROTEIN IQM6 [Salix purpurea]